MPNTHRLDSEMLVKHQVSVAVTAAETDGASVDTEAVSADSALAIFFANPSGASTTVDGAVQESSTGTGAWADVSGSAIAQVITSGATGSQLNAPALQLVAVDVRKRKRYLRCRVTGAGASAAGQAYATLVLGRLRNLAPSQDNTVVSV